MTQIRKSILINAPIEKVYAFARDPEKWNRWFVGLSVPEETKGHGEAGTTTKHKYTMAGVEFPMIAKVVEDTPGPKVARWRGTFEGPLSGQHAWTYTAKGDATEMAGELDYTIPGSIIGKIADKLVIEKLQERAIEHSLENLKLLCEAEVTAKIHV